MEKFATLTAIAVPFEDVNVDTDQIIPARFLRTPRKDGYARFLFHDRRVGQDGQPLPGFPLDVPAYRGAAILVANTNFGCGSSREGAVYALMDSGFRAVVAPSLGDIFHNNCLKNGVLPVRLPEAVVASLRSALAAKPGATMKIDLPAQTVTHPSGEQSTFAIDPLAKRCLIEGLDEIALTKSFGAEIDAFADKYRRRRPWLFAAQGDKILMETERR